MTEFYNAENIIGAEEYRFEEEKLNQLLEFLQMRGLIEINSEIVSLQEKITSMAKEITAGAFRELLVVYHGSEKRYQQKRERQFQ